MILIIVLERKDAIPPRWRLWHVDCYSGVQAFRLVILMFIESNYQIELKRSISAGKLCFSQQGIKIHRHKPLHLHKSRNSAPHLNPQIVLAQPGSKVYRRGRYMYLYFPS